MDRQAALRFILYGSILVLFGLAASTPGAQGVLLYALLVPAAFGLIALLLLGIPIAAMEHAEGERVKWRSVLDFAQHNVVLAFFDVLVLVDAALVAGYGWAQMGLVGRGIYLVAVLAGGLCALTGWFMGQQSDRKQRSWQKHPND